MSGDLRPDFNTVLLFKGGDEIFFFPGFTGAADDVGFDGGGVDRRLKGRKKKKMKGISLS